MRRSFFMFRERRIGSFSNRYGSNGSCFYDETPQHKANFLKLVKEGKFDSVLFHRVIEDFMIQTGDVSTGTSGEAVRLQIAS